MTTNPIIVPMEDVLVHTAENGYTCNQLDCPCNTQDRIADRLPSEAQLDEQEVRVSIGTRVLIEVEIRGFYAGSMMIAGGWMPLSRIKAVVS